MTKSTLLSAAVFLLVVLGQNLSPFQVRAVTVEPCTPGSIDITDCTSNGCPGTKTRKCNASGTGWSGWSSCSKTNPSCGGVSLTCQPPKMVCSNSCVELLRDNNNCGACGVKCVPNPTTKVNTTCFQGKCIPAVISDPGGPVNCPSNITKANCESTSIGGHLVSEPSHTRNCDPATGRMCSYYREECEINGQHCLLGITQGQCTPDVVCGGPSGSANPTSTPRSSLTPSPTPKVSPSPSPIVAASCRMIVMYTTAWKPLTDFSTYKTGSQFYMCTYGSANSGVFTKARFTVNAELRPETTYKMPGTTNYFCDLYTVPTDTYDFTVTSEVYHSLLGWRQ